VFRLPGGHVVIRRIALVLGAALIAWTATAASAAPNTSVTRAPATADRTPGRDRPVTAYVLGAHAVTPIRTATNTAGKSIRFAAATLAEAATPNGKTVYVALDVNGLLGLVTPIRTATNTAGKPIKVGSVPIAIAITPNGKTAYVANSNSDTVTPIRTATNSPGKPIKIGHGLQYIVVTPDGATLYAVSYVPGKSIQGLVTPISTATTQQRNRSRSAWRRPPSRSRRAERPLTSPSPAPIPSRRSGSRRTRPRRPSGPRPGL